MLENKFRAMPSEFKEENFELDYFQMWDKTNIFAYTHKLSYFLLHPHLRGNHLRMVHQNKNVNQERKI